MVETSPTAIEVRQPALPLGDTATPAPAAPVAGAPAPAVSPPAAETKPAEGAAVLPPSAAPEIPPVELSTDKPTLLEKHVDAEKAAAAEKAPEVKEPDKPAPAEAKPAEVVPPPPPAEPIKFDFKMPEALKSTKADDPNMVAFATILGESPKSPQEAGQKLLDLHANAMAAYDAHLRAEQHKAFNQTREAWAKEVLADPEIGGAGHQTAMSAIARARDMLVSTARPGTPKYQSDLKAFDDFLRITGAGDNPVFLKVLHNAARYFDEPALPPESPRPPPDNGKSPRGGARVLYDNPRSNPNRQ